MHQFDRSWNSVSAQEPPSELQGRRFARGWLAWIIAPAVGVLLLFGHHALILLEGGFIDDGPFYSVQYRGAVPARPPDQEIAIGHKTLRVYNGATSSPLLVLMNNSGNLERAELLDVKTNPKYHNCSITSVVIRSIESSPHRYGADILSKWTYGTECGRIYFWRSGRVHRFYLSW